MNDDTCADDREPVSRREALQASSGLAAAVVFVAGGGVVLAALAPHSASARTDYEATTERDAVDPVRTIVGWLGDTSSSAMNALRTLSGQSAAVVARSDGSVTLTSPDGSTIVHLFPPQV